MRCKVFNRSAGVCLKFGNGGSYTSPTFAE
jgi:hypothetical protein